LDDAIDTLQKALARLEPDEFYWRSVFETRLINALIRKGDIDGAEAVVREAVGRAPMTEGAPRGAGGALARRMMDLGVFLAEQDRFLLHEWFCAEIAQVFQGSIPRGKPGIAGFVVIYASALVDQGEYSQAEPYLRHCLNVRRLAYPDGALHTAHVSSLLGAALIGQSRYNEAEPVLLEACNAVENAPRVSPHRVEEAMRRIIDLYEAWNKPTKASEWRLRLSDREQPRSAEEEGGLPEGHSGAPP
jgi:tetratricopeptide (TPR) repeat protein